MAHSHTSWPRIAFRQYDWERWFDGQIHTLTRSVDFEIETERFRHQVYENAARRGVRARTRVIGEQVFVQAIGKRRVPHRCLSVSAQQSLASEAT